MRRSQVVHHHSNLGICWRQDNNKLTCSFEFAVGAQPLEQDLPKRGKGCSRDTDSQGFCSRSRTFRRPDTCHVNAYSISALSFSLLDHGSDIKELHMRWQPIAPINAPVVHRRIVCPIENHPPSMSPRRSQSTADEETPLLHGENSPRKPTPLPVTQISLLLLLLLSEPVTSLSINPYINQACMIDSLSTHLR